ncbi:hypothetical protein M9H77_35459 [Catharanthus roseus]|uniref:Uncharacterized protein n=1 Tax=Catharanthus roseus TaxID=4058 RepID=A0ACB9ZQT1_CATRO|nr:hypothetical protein M9H77_35459 [Catharanthus roseus]
MVGLRRLKMISKEDIVDKEENSEDQEIASFEGDEKGMNLVIIRVLTTQLEEFEGQGKASKLFSIISITCTQGFNGQIERIVTLVDKSQANQ